MQVLFGADEMGSIKSLARKSKNVGKKAGRATVSAGKATGRATVSAGKATARIGAKTVRATAPLAPAIAFIPGVGPVVATGLVAAKAGLDASAKARAAASKTKGIATAPRAAVTAAVNKAASSVGQKLGLKTAPRSAVTQSVKKAGSKKIGSKFIPNISKQVAKQFSPASLPEVVKKVPIITDMPDTSSVQPGVSPDVKPASNNTPLIIGAVAVGALLLMGKKK